MLAAEEMAAPQAATFHLVRRPHSHAKLLRQAACGGGGYPERGDERVKNRLHHLGRPPPPRWRLLLLHASYGTAGGGGEV